MRNRILRYLHFLLEISLKTCGQVLSIESISFLLRAFVSKSNERPDAVKFRWSRYDIKQMDPVHQNCRVQEKSQQTQLIDHEDPNSLRRYLQWSGCNFKRNTHQKLRQRLQISHHLKEFWWIKVCIQIHNFLYFQDHPWK